MPIFAPLLLLALAAEPGWSRAAEVVGVTVDQRQVTGERSRSLRAEGVVDAPPAACLAAVRDTGFFRRSMPFVEVAEVVAREGEAVTFFHSRVAPPFCAARESTLRVVVEPLPAGGWRQAWAIANERGPAAQGGAVLVTLNTGSWEFTPIDGGRRTLVRYRILTDPGGDLPEWLVERCNVSAVVEAFHQLRQASGAGEPTEEVASGG